MTTQHQFEDGHTETDNLPLDFSDYVEITGKVIFCLFNAGLFIWIFSGLFDAASPVFSAVFSVFIGLFALICVSPATALAAYLFSIVFSGALAIANRPKTS
ncbi:hypothetical protein RSJ68_08575 [Neisseria sp. DTU_2020_1000833_1_SI_GRL_NUU_006]|jgi:putative membrane protein|nr:MAG: hypothetical protein D8H97_03920 [Neisseria sp.]WNU96495.1 hypothetical protein RSJ68_08575 [Neisseria sp. DTU_2020_1000833_1_SI_GRL_NUU_006]